MRGKIKRGFTLIEVSLAMTVIGVLSIAVIVIISNAVSSYHKGVTMNQLNTAGMALMENIRTSIETSPARSVIDDCTTLYNYKSQTDFGNSACVKDKAMSFVTITKRGNTKVQGTNTTISDAPLSGIFCTGKYTYLWNSGYILNDNNPNNDLKIKYAYQGAGGVSNTVTTEAARLMRFNDDSRMICKTIAGYQMDETNGGKYLQVSRIFDSMENRGVYDGTNNTMDVSKVILFDEPAKDILETNSNLALYDFSVEEPATVTGLNEMYYSLSFILGTLRGGADISKSGEFCVDPYGDNTDFDYCAINKFNFAAQALGG